MKSCPTCNRTYADETLTYCLADGSLLSAPYDPEATQRIPPSRVTNAPTEVLPRSQPTTIKPHIIYAIAGLLAVVVIAGMVAWLRSGSEINSSVTPTSTPASAAPTIAPKATPKPPETKTVTVNAQRMWTNSNIYLNEGDSIKIEASGQVNGDTRPNSPANRWVGPDGWGSESPRIKAGSQLRWVLGNSSSYICLTGRVGDDEPFKVGSRYSFKASSSGYLYFGINDEAIDENGQPTADGGLAWRDNAGAFNVKVTKQSP